MWMAAEVKILNMVKWKQKRKVGLSWHLPVIPALGKEKQEGWGRPHRETPSRETKNKKTNQTNKTEKERKKNEKN